MRRITARHALVAGGAAVVLAGSALGGIALAQQAPATSTPTAQPRPDGQNKSEAFLQALAHRLNISEDQLKQDIQGARQDAGLPANGGPGPFGAFPGGGPRAGMPGMNVLRQAAQAVADTLHIDVATLRQELPGHTLAQVAQNYGVSRDQLISALTTSLDQQIDQAASNGKLSTDQATSLKDRVAQQLPNLLDRQWPQPGQGAQPGQGHGHGRPHGARPGANPTSSQS